MNNGKIIKIWRAREAEKKTEEKTIKRIELVIGRPCHYITNYVCRRGKRKRR